MKSAHHKHGEESETVIVLAEDEPVIRNLVLLMLEKQGYAVLTANDGQEALEICEKFASPIQLLLTDVGMPKMDGVTLAEKVRARRPEIKIIAMSGGTTMTVLKENVPDAFLRKPFKPPTLLQCVQRVLASSFSGMCEEV